MGASPQRKCEIECPQQQCLAFALDIIAMHGASVVMRKQGTPQRRLRVLLHRQHQQHQRMRGASVASSVAAIQDTMVLHLQMVAPEAQFGPCKCHRPTSSWQRALSASAGSSYADAEYWRRAVLLLGQVHIPSKYSSTAQQRAHFVEYLRYYARRAHYSTCWDSTPWR